MSRAFLRLACLTAASTILACTGAGGGATDAGTGTDGGSTRELERTSAPVSAAAGGSVTTTTGAKLTIPPGAIASDVVVSVVVTEQPVAGFAVNSPVYTFGPDGLSFSTPVAITIPVKDAAGAVIFWSKLGKPNEFEPVPTERGDGVLIGYVRHFSSGFAGSSTAASCENVTCPPRASTCSSASVLTLSGEGACVDGQCQYPTETVTCSTDTASGGAGCRDGACRVDCNSANTNGQRLIDCDGSATTGCETNPRTDPVNCGGCGIVCTASERCSDDFCVPSTSCRLAMDCVGRCADSGAAIPGCFDSCASSLAGESKTAYTTLRTCLEGACPTGLTLECGGAAIEGACKAQANTCKGPDLDACTSNDQCTRFGPNSKCQEGHCTRDNGNQNPGGTRCTNATMSVDCAQFGQNARCENGYCQGGQGKPCTAATVETDCGFMGPGARCEGGFCAGGGGPSCNTSQDCAAYGQGLRCEAGICVGGGGGGCTDDAACIAVGGPRALCEDGVCMSGPSAGPPCENNQDCTDRFVPGSTCVQKECRLACTEANVDEACQPMGLGADAICKAGYCERKPECETGAAGDAVCATRAGAGSTCSRLGTCKSPPPLECANDATCVSARGPLAYCMRPPDGAGSPGYCQVGECSPTTACTRPNTECVDRTCQPLGRCSNEGQLCPPSAIGLGLICRGGSCVQPACSSNESCARSGGIWSAQIRCQQSPCSSNDECVQRGAGTVCTGYVEAPWLCNLDRTDCASTRRCAPAQDRCERTPGPLGTCRNQRNQDLRITCEKEADCPAQEGYCDDMDTPEAEDDRCSNSPGVPCSTDEQCTPVPSFCDDPNRARCVVGGNFCASNADCTAPATAQECVQRSDLGTMGTCDAGSCSPAGGCRTSEDCATDLGVNLTCTPQPCSSDAQCPPAEDSGPTCVNGGCRTQGQCEPARETCLDLLSSPAFMACLSWQLGTSSTLAQVVSTCAPLVKAEGERTAVTAVVACVDSNAPSTCDDACVKATMDASCRLERDSCSP